MLITIASRSWLPNLSLSHCRLFNGPAGWGALARWRALADDGAHNTALNVAIADSWCRSRALQDRSERNVVVRSAVNARLAFPDA